MFDDVGCCSYDVIVAGVGGMGSAALYHLARRGLKVRMHGSCSDGRVPSWDINSHKNTVISTLHTWRNVTRQCIAHAS